MAWRSTLARDGSVRGGMIAAAEARAGAAVWQNGPALPNLPTGHAAAGPRGLGIGVGIAPIRPPIAPGLVTVMTERHCRRMWCGRHAENPRARNRWNGLGRGRWQSSPSWMQGSLSRGLEGGGRRGELPGVRVSTWADPTATAERTYLWRWMGEG